MDLFQKKTIKRRPSKTKGVGQKSALCRKKKVQAPACVLVLLREAASWAQAQPNIVIFVVNIFGPQDSSSNQERLLKVSTAKKNFIW